MSERDGAPLRSGPSDATRRGDLPPDGLLEYWDALRERWRLIIGVTVAVVGLVLLVSLLVDKLYRASATLQIERDISRVVNVEDVTPAEAPLDRDFYQTQYELLQARSLAARVVRDARLATATAYREVVEDATERVAADATPALRAAAVERALVREVLEHLEIEPVRNSRLVRINVESTDPEIAARVANAYTRAYIDSSRERRADTSTSAVKFLSDRLESMRQRVETSERGLVDFAGDEQIVDMGVDKPSLTSQNLSELNALLAAAQDSRIKADAAWQRARTGGGLGLPQVVANPLIQNLRQTLASLRAEYQQKLSTYKPGYPEMARLRGQINELQRQVTAEVANVRTAIRTEFETAQLQEQLIEERIGGLKSAELDLQGRRIRYNMLQRDVDKNRQLYEALLQRYKEVGIASQLGADNISVIDAAEVPGSPASPKLLFNLALALVFGLALGVLLALAGHMVASERRVR